MAIRLYENLKYRAKGYMTYTFDIWAPISDETYYTEWTKLTKEQAEEIQKRLLNGEFD